MSGFVPKAVHILSHLILIHFNDIYVSTGTLDIRTLGPRLEPRYNSKIKALYILVEVLLLKSTRPPESTKRQRKIAVEQAEEESSRDVLDPNVCIHVQGRAYH